MAKRRKVPEEPVEDVKERIEVLFSVEVKKNFWTGRYPKSEYIYAVQDGCGGTFDFEKKIFVPPKEEPALGPCEPKKKLLPQKPFAEPISLKDRVQWGGTITRSATIFFVGYANRLYTFKLYSVAQAVEVMCRTMVCGYPDGVPPDIYGDGLGNIHVSSN